MKQLNKLLTKKQGLVYSYIVAYILNKKYSPSFRDIAKQFNMTVKGAYDHIKAIQKKGYIEYTPNTARSLTYDPEVYLTYRYLNRECK